MSKGAILIAKNNGEIDYIKQAVFLAKRIKYYLNIPTSVITDCEDYLRAAHDFEVFDQIIPIDYAQEKNKRAYHDGTLFYKSANFRNNERNVAYDLSPYQETLLLDTDYIINNDLLKSCFESTNDFMLFKSSEDVANVRDTTEFEHVSDYSIDFYWATVVFFRKTEINKIFFELVSHIKENWKHYVRVYQIESFLFRNDYAFSIAIHIMNGFQQGDFAQPLPGKHLYTTDRDLLWKLSEDEMTFLVEKKNYLGEYTALQTKGQSIHVMNKFSLERIIDREFENE